MRLYIHPLGLTPGRDKDEAGNQAKLDQLPHPFSAWCASGSDDDDGRLEWSNRIAPQIRHTMRGAQRLVAAYDRSEVPLEIGHTEPETTILHLRRSGGVARWPYGHDDVTVLLSTRRTAGRTTALETPEVLEGAPIAAPTPA